MTVCRRDKGNGVSEELPSLQGVATATNGKSRASGQGEASGFPSRSALERVRGDALTLAALKTNADDGVSF